MTDTSGTKKKANRWLCPLLADLVIVALAAWAFNKSQRESSPAERMASDPLSRTDTNQMGQPNPPSNIAAADLAGGDRGNASAIENADTVRANPQPGADPSRDGVPGAPGAPAPANTPSPNP